MKTSVEAALPQRPVVHVIVFLQACLTLFVASLETVFLSSRVSILSGSTLWYKLTFYLQLSTSLFVLLLPLSVVACGAVWLSRGGFGLWRPKVLATLGYSLPFVGFAVMNFIYLDRWLYSSFGSNVTSRSGWITLTMAAYAALVSERLFARYFDGISSWVTVRRTVVATCILSVFGVGSVSLADVAAKNLRVATVQDRQSALESTPNIVFLTYDMFLSSRTPLLGYERSTTPNLLRRRDEFQVFANAIGVARESRSGLGAMLSGRSPTKTHLFSNPDRLHGADSYLHLPALLKGRGYTTVNLGTEPYSNPLEFDMLGGFSRVNDLHLDSEAVSRKVVERLRMLFPTLVGALTETLVHARDTITYVARVSDDLVVVQDAALVKYTQDYFPMTMDALDEVLEEGRPFFLHVHSVITHLPFTQRRELRFSDYIDNCVSFLKQELNCAGEQMSDQEETDLYDDSLLRMDSDVEKIMLKLQKYRQLDNTLLIIASDHEYRWRTRGDPIGLLVRVPGIEGQVIDERVWGLDIAPTVLELLGADAPAWMDGESLLPLIRGDEGGSDRFDERIVHLVHGIENEGGTLVTDLVLLKKNWKYVQPMDRSGGTFMALETPSAPDGDVVASAELERTFRRQAQEELERERDRLVRRIQ